MKIALIQAPIEDFYYTPQRSYPLGLTYLAASVMDLPVDVEIIDFITGHGRQTISLPNNFKAIMKYLPYDRSPIAAFHNYYHVGASWEKIKSFFSKNNFDLYAISSNFFTYSDEVIKTAEIIKSCNPEAIVIVGGQNVGPEHSLFTDCPDIDFCLQGEGDIAFHKFIEAFINNTDLSNLPGIFNKNKGSWNSVGIVQEFDNSPLAGKLPAETYKIAGDPAIMIATSRGCPMGCRFCSVSRTFGCDLRLKPVNIVLNEIRLAYDRGIRAFDIEDDNFTFVKKHCLKLLSGISKEFSGKIKLYAMNGLSAEHLDEEIIDLLYNSGMKLLNLSIATSSEEQLKKLHRNTRTGHFQEISNYAANKGITVMGHFIAGLPGQSADEILETMKVLSELPLVLGISPFYYIPGMNMGVPNPPTHCKDARLSRFWPADDELDELELITLFRLSRWINYLKACMKKRHIPSIRFHDIAATFPNDPYINKLIEKKEIVGKNNKNTFYTQLISHKIINSFFAIFKDSDVYCA